MNTISSVLPASEARDNFYTMLDEVSDKLRRFTITLRGKVKAVVMSAEEVESWEETLEIMSNKKLVAQINEGLDDVKHGRVISLDDYIKKHEG
ncbi:MAG: type II toxin-antitoxin system Phd/YefM family antitoxin [Patescibacteria group bacterium]|nr:type II toxin-antitoxin system Phd/YefM family antitoxin [Patescibacteria group bacterium]